jgi:hypothetical protein
MINHLSLHPMDDAVVAEMGFLEAFSIFFAIITGLGNVSFSQIFFLVIKTSLSLPTLVLSCPILEVR